uniref:BAR/IMD domain-containing adapter protein 2 n=1 Tax=Scophthalmus maximus TaxID=52904 RepID=A0A8D3AQA0_SCOMX
MSRTEEVNKMTENVYKGILDQFNPSLKNFVTMGKHYEKALTGVTVAAKGYFDTLVKLGELASDSQGSKELGDTLFQMAEVHRQIQVQLEDVLKLFHSELLAQLEQKLELDIKYLTATLKKYQSERRSKSESIERCQSQLKKLRRKSQGSRHPNKYGDREMQFVELMSRRQGELDTLVAAGYKSALTEERRRYCFLVDRQCCVTKLLINYHSKVRELLSQKLSSWQQSCSQPTKLPERALNLLRHTAPQSPGAAGIAEVLRHTKLGSTHAPLSRAMTPVQLLHQQVGPAGSNTSSPSHNPWLLKAAEMCSTATLPLPRRPVSEMRLGGFQGKTCHSVLVSFVFVCLHRQPSFLISLLDPGSSLPRMLPLSGPIRVEAKFPHAPGASEGGGGGGGACLLHFLAGDNISLLISEPRDGWHYGQNERTGRKGWFPFSYTQPHHSKMDHLERQVALNTKHLKVLRLMMIVDSLNCRNASTTSFQTFTIQAPLKKSRALPPQRVSTFRPRPYSMADSNKVRNTKPLGGGQRLE